MNLFSLVKPVEVELTQSTTNPYLYGAIGFLIVLGVMLLMRFEWQKNRVKKKD